jgi:glycosyltransferase involved in cell wall biosynthesis
MADPAVSVVLPVRDSATFVAEAIHTVLAQTYGDYEIIVVDDGSTDGTADVVAAFGAAVRLVQQEPSGAATARNRGVREAHGELIAFLDADDLWVPDKLERQMVILVTAPEIDGVFGGMVQTGMDGVAEPEAPIMAAYSPSVALLRRRVFERVGMLNEERRVGEFVEWCAHAEEAGLRFVMLPEVLGYRRLHGSNMGVRERDARIEYVRIVRSRLHRLHGTLDVSRDSDA